MSSSKTIAICKFAHSKLYKFVSNFVQFEGTLSRYVHNHPRPRPQWTYTICAPSIFLQTRWKLDELPRTIRPIRRLPPTLSMEYKWHWANNRDRQPSGNRTPTTTGVLHYHVRINDRSDPIPPFALLRSSFYYPCVGTYTFLDTAFIAFVAMHKWNIPIQRSAQTSLPCLPTCKSLFRIR